MRALACSNLRSDAFSDLASRSAAVAAVLVSSALLAASSASRPSVAARDGTAASAAACGTNKAGWENSTGATSPGAMITRMPIQVRSNSFSAKP